MSAEHPNVTVLQSRAIQHLLLQLRDKNTQTEKFQVIGDRLMAILGEEALCRLPTVKEGLVDTPCGQASGPLEVKDGHGVCVVSIVRSGDILQEAVRALRPGLSVGKILIQRDESRPDKPANLMYSKFPKNIRDCYIILVDPMMATGGSALQAIKVLQESHVSTQNIMFLNLICSPEGLRVMAKNHPEIPIITCNVDSHLNEDKYIVPGLGDFGDRYYGTT